MISSEEYKILKSFAERIPDNDPGAHNNLAVVYYNKGLYDDAIGELEKALLIDPNFILARNNMDLILKKSGKLEDKAKELGRIIETEPFDEHSTLELADTYRKLNRFSQAIIFYKKILDYNPGSYEAHFGLGITLRSLGKYDDALEELKRSLEIKISPEGYRSLGEVYFNKGVIDLAIKSFQESILLDSASAEGHFLLGFALGEKGKLKEGLEEIHRAIAINPALAQFEPNLPIDLKEHKGQWEFLREQLGIPKASVNEYQAHFNLGITYLNKGLFSESKREFDECLKVRNDHAELLTALGEIEIFLNHLPEARKHLDHSLEIDFSSARSTNDMGIVFLKNNDYANADVWFNKALGIEHNYPSAMNNIAVVELSQNKIEQAITRLVQAAKLGSQEARYNLGMYYLRKGDYEHALKTFDGTTADDLFARGLIYSETGRDEESIAAFKGSLNIAPMHAGAYYNMGFVLMKVGKYDEGLSYIRKGMEIEPNFEKEKYRLAIVPDLYEFGPYYTIAPAKETAEVTEQMTEFFPTAEPEPNTEDFMSMAENAVRRNELDNALAMVEEAIKRSPESNQPVIMKARILFQSDNYDDAIDVLNAHNAKHPEDTEVKQVTAELLKSVGQLEEARQLYEALAEKQPQKVEWLTELAALHYTLGANEKALDIYNRLFALDSNNVQTHLGLLKIYLKNNSKEKALPHVHFLEQHHPDLYEASVYTGIYWLDNGDRQKAKTLLEKAIELDHSKPLPYYHLGLVEVQHGDFNNACDHWKKALLLSPVDDLSEKITHCLNITMEMLEFLKKEIR